MKLLSITSHYVLYYIIWIACIFFAVQDRPWTGILVFLCCQILQIGIQAARQIPWHNAIKYAFAAWILGTLTDTFWMQMGWVTFRANPFAPWLSPPWMMALWFSFGFTTVVTSKNWMHRYVLWGLLALICVPWAYALGNIASAMSVNLMPQFYIIIGIVWMLLLPLMNKLLIRED